MTSTSTEITISQKTQKAIDQIRSPEISLGIEEALPENVSLQQFQRAAVTALMDNAQLVDAERKSLVQSIIRCAQDGLLPDGRDAALVIYGKSVQYLPMIGGLRRIAAEHGMSIHASVVFKNDQFDPDPENHKVNHKPTRLGQERGPIIGAYAIAEHKDGRRFGPVIMDMDDINRVRAKSAAKNGDAWKNWFDRMAEKSVARRLFKELPFDSKDRERINHILAADNEEDPVTALYGAEFTEPPEPIPDEADDGLGKPVEEAEWEETPFEGEEAISDSDETPLALKGATFTGGQYKGKTVEEVYALGDAGANYIKGAIEWANDNQKTGDMVDDLKAFAELHPEVVS